MGIDDLSGATLRKQILGIPCGGLINNHPIQGGVAILLVPALETRVK